MKYEVTFWSENSYAIPGSPEQFEVVGNMQVDADDEISALSIAEKEASRRYHSKIVIEMAGNIIEF